MSDAFLKGLDEGSSDEGRQGGMGSDAIQQSQDSCLPNQRVQGIQIFGKLKIPFSRFLKFLLYLKAQFVLVRKEKKNESLIENHEKSFVNFESSVSDVTSENPLHEFTHIV